MKIHNILKITFLSIFISSSFAQVKSKLPFIGTRSYNFAGGSCCKETITIYENGNCEIVGYGDPNFGDGSTVFYSGVYNDIIWIYEKGEKSFGYKIGAKYITQLNKDGKPEIGCKGENLACTVELCK